VRWVCLARGHSPGLGESCSLRGSGNLTGLYGWPSASSSWRAQKVGKPAEGTYIFVPGDNKFERTPAPNLQSTRGPSLVSKARHTSPSRLARGPAPPPTAAVANTATAPPVYRSEPRFLGSQKPRAQRWPPQAPPHCAAVQATLRPARHRWRRSRQTAPPPPTASHKPRGCPRGDYGGLPGRWPPTPPEGHHRKLRGHRCGAVYCSFYNAHIPPSPPIIRRRHPTTVAAAKIPSKKYGWDSTAPQLYQTP